MIELQCSILQRVILYARKRSRQFQLLESIIKSISFFHSVASASTDDVKLTIDNAQQAFESGVWSKSPAILRSTVLSKLARKLEEGIPDLTKIETMQTGRTLREMKAQLGRLPEWL